jgi:pilus assembly protein CpaB
MKKIRIIALIAAVVAAVAVYKLLDVLSQPPETPRTDVVMAAADIPQNTVITADMVALQPVATEAVAADGFTSLDTVVGMVAKTEILAGEQVRSGRLVQMGEAADTSSSTLAYVVEPGMRAVTIAVSETTGLDTMLKPGNRVDVIMNYSYTAPAADGTADTTVTEARLLMENVSVLAVGTALGAEGVTPDVGYTSVTLMVTPEQALALSYGEYTSNLRLVLRSPLDTQETQTPAVKNQDFMN